MITGSHISFVRHVMRTRAAVSDGGGQCYDCREQRITAKNEVNDGEDEEEGAAEDDDKKEDEDDDKKENEDDNKKEDEEEEDEEENEENAIEEEGGAGEDENDEKKTEKRSVALRLTGNVVTVRPHGDIVCSNIVRKHVVHLEK